MSHDIRVKCNYPQGGQPFQREKYRELDWICNRGNQHDPDRHASISFKSAGTFHFEYSATDDDDDDKLMK